MADFEEGHLLTRAETACILNTLLGRQETITTDFDLPIYDLSPKHPRYADLMEAAADHEEGTDSWVILRIDDESFYCDPESEMNMRAHSQPWNLYKIPRAKLADVGYREPEKNAE